MTLAPITGHADTAVGRLIEQYRGKPRVSGIARDVAEGLQGVEDAIWKVAAARSLDTAQGAALEALGTLVGFQRQGLDDEAYRVVLRGVIGENNSDGSRDTAVNVLRSLFQPEGVFVHNRLRPGSVGYGIAAPGVRPDLWPLMRSVFQRSLPAGVDLAFLASHASPAFAMESDQPWVGGFGGLPSTSVNLLDPNVATCGDVDGDTPEWIPCTSMEAFGTTTGGAGTVVGCLTTDASADPSTAWQGSAALSIHGAGGDKVGAKTTVSGLTPGENYTFSYYAFNWGGSGANVAPQVFSADGLVNLIYSTGGTAVSAFGWSRFAGTFNAPHATVELRVVEVIDGAYWWLVDGVQLEQAFSASAWQNPTPTPGAAGAPWASPIP